MQLMARNFYKVPKRKWRKWSDVARGTFNRTYPFVRDSQALFTHPKAEKQKRDHWKTVAWNTAWIAADHADETLHEMANG